MTGIGQTTGQICLANAHELGCDLMEITAHAGARPSHSYWQGQVVSLSGRKGYLSLSDIGYGSGDGFKGGGTAGTIGIRTLRAVHGCMTKKS